MADAVIEKIKEHFADGQQNFLDGLSVAYDDWRFNLRKSNTEPLLRLNVEARGDKRLLREKTQEILGLIR